MAPSNVDDNYKYLITCIRHSSNGKVDFEEVRKECCIISKGAAAKRYEQMMRFLDYYEGRTSIIDASQNTAAQTRRVTFQDIVGPSKKRKRERYIENEAGADHDRDKSTQSAEASNKKVRIESGSPNQSKPGT